VVKSNPLWTRCPQQRAWTVPHQAQNTIERDAFAPCNLGHGLVESLKIDARIAVLCNHCENDVCVDIPEFSVQ
jgi:hypothetical protein